MEEIGVNFWKEKTSFCEIGQPTGIHFAFLSPDNEQCHGWIKCRDFLHDALRGHVQKTKQGIYGFSYAPSENPALDLGKMRMLVKRVYSTNVKKKDALKILDDIITRALKLIRCVEKTAKIKPLSEVYAVKKNKEVYIFEGAKDWMESTFMISLYTFLIRLGAKEIDVEGEGDLYPKLEELTKSKKRDHDIAYLIKVLPYMEKIVTNRKKLRYMQKGEPFLKNSGINLFHNYTGIVSLVDYAAKKTFTTSDKEKLGELIALTEVIK